MILFRVINKDEYDELFKGIPRSVTTSRYSNPSKNYNSFNYCDGINYMHFFKFAEHARKYMYKFGNRIIMCDIPDDIIDQFGYGSYPYDDNENISIPVPEYVIKRDDFDTDYIVKDRPKKIECIQYINGVNAFTIYNQILEKIYNDFNEKHEIFDRQLYVRAAVNYLLSNDIDFLLYWYSSRDNKKDLKVLQRNR